MDMREAVFARMSMLDPLISLKERGVPGKELFVISTVKSDALLVTELFLSIKKILLGLVKSVEENTIFLEAIDFFDLTFLYVLSKIAIAKSLCNDRK